MNFSGTTTLERTNMKNSIRIFSLISASLLLGLAAQGQQRFSSRPAASVSYERIAALNCTPGAGLMELISSGCLWDRTKVTAVPSNPKAVGFYIAIAYQDSSGAPQVSIQITTTKDADGKFTITQPLQGIFPIISVSALELLPGELVYAQ